MMRRRKQRAVRIDYSRLHETGYAISAEDQAREKEVRQQKENNREMKQLLSLLYSADDIDVGSQE